MYRIIENSVKVINHMNTTNGLVFALILLILALLLEKL